MEAAQTNETAPRRKPGRQKGQTVTGINRIGLDVSISYHKMESLLRKFPDRKYVHEAIDQVKELGYLKPAERTALVHYAIKVITQSIVVDGEQPDDVQRLKASLKETENELRVVVSRYPGQHTAWINNGKKQKQALIGSVIEEGWQYGRIKSPGLIKAQKAATAAALIKTPTGPVGSHWYTDGTKNVRVPPGREPPTGFVLGRRLDDAHKARIAGRWTKIKDDASNVVDG